MKTAAATTPLDNHREEWPLEQLQEEADALRQRLNRFRKSLSRFFVAADDCPSGDEDQNKVRRHAEYFNVRHNRHMEYS